MDDYGVWEQYSSYLNTIHDHCSSIANESTNIICLISSCVSYLLRVSIEAILGLGRIRVSRKFFFFFFCLISGDPGNI